MLLYTILYVFSKGRQQMSEIQCIEHAFPLQFIKMERNHEIFFLFSHEEALTSSACTSSTFSKIEIEEQFLRAKCSVFTEKCLSIE